MAGMTSTVSAVEEARPNSSEIASPWKIGIGEDDGGADHGGERGQQDRLEADRAGFEQHLDAAAGPVACGWRMKSTSRIELRTMMPASAMKPIIDVAVKGAANSQWPIMMPMKVSGIGVRMTSGSLNEPNWATTRM